ncbi:7865_t:CDS:2, partial [Ambispora leptoticha]
LEKLMPVFDGENMEIEIWPELLPGEKPHILITYDEFMFLSYDGMPMCWMPKDLQLLEMEFYKI